MSFEDPAGTWNRRFAAEGFLFGTQPNAWLREHAGCWHPGDRVLCVADGEGRNSVWLARRGLQVDAFDISPVAVRKAQALAAERGVQVHFEVADADGFAWPEAAFDGVAAIFVQFADPALRARMFDRMVRALRPGGVLVLQGYGLRQLEFRTGGPGVPEHLYTPELLREMFAQLEILALRDEETELSEGTAHKGRSHVLGLVARKPA